MGILSTKGKFTKRDEANSRNAVVRKSQASFQAPLGKGAVQRPMPKLKNKKNNKGARMV